MLDKGTYKQSESSLASQFLFTKRAHQKPSQATKDRGQEVHSVFVLMHEMTVSFPQWQAGFEAFSTGWGKGNKEKGQETDCSRKSGSGNAGGGFCTKKT